MWESIWEKSSDEDQKPHASIIDKLVNQNANEGKNSPLSNLISKHEDNAKNDRWNFLSNNKKDVVELKNEVLPEFSSEVQNIVNEVQNTHLNNEPEGRTLLKKFLKAVKEVDLKGIFDWVVGLFSTMMWKKALTNTKQWWNPQWNDRNWREDKFTQNDIDGLVELCKKESEIWKKNMYARLIARRKDAECESTIFTEPEKTLDLLNHHAKSWRIKEGDVINFAWNATNALGNAKEAAIQTITWSDRTHSAIITKTQPLEITHASAKWVHTMPLIQYLKEYKEITYSIIQWWWKPAVDYALSQVWKKYDAKSGVKRNFWDESEQFCSELTIRALWKSWLLNIDPEKCEANWEIYPRHLFDLSYPKYVNEYPVEFS